MSTQTVVDVVISGSTTTVVDKRIDGVTTVAGAPPVTNVSGQVPDLGVNTDILATEGDILSLTNDVASLRANLIVTGTTLTDEIGVLSGHVISTGNNLEFQISTLSGNLIASGNNLDSLRDVLSGNLAATGASLNASITGITGDTNTLTNNLISTGNNLQTQILNSGDILDDLSGNLITTGQTLTSSLISTGNLIQPQIDNIESNLITTGQTLLTTGSNLQALIVEDINNLIDTGNNLEPRINTNAANILTLNTATGTLSVATGELQEYKFNKSGGTISGVILPPSSGTLDFGSESLPFRTGFFDDLKLSSNTLFIGDVSIGASNGGIDFSNATGVTVFQDVSIRNLTVTGTETIIDVEHLAVKDNIIIINSGETDAGIAVRSGGLVIDRGTLPDADLLFNENNDRFEFNFPLAINNNVVVTKNETGVYADASNLQQTGVTLQTQITNNDADITALNTATGELKTQSNTTDSNLITTGKFLTDEIAIVSGIAGGSTFDELSGDLIITGQTLTSEISIVSGLIGQEASDIDGLSGNLITTGQALTNTIISTGSLLDTLSGNLNTTGVTLQNQITSNDSDISTLTSNLRSTGVTLQTQITSNDLDIAVVTNLLIETGFAVMDTSGNADTTSGNLISTGQYLTNEIATVSGMTTGGVAADIISGNLITTGQTLTSDIGVVSGLTVTNTNNLISTGNNLQGQITSNDGQIAGIIGDLVNTGQTLTTNINTVSSNLITTGKNLSADIATVSGIAGGQDFDTLSGNLITTGQTLTSEIAIVSGLAGGEDFNTLSGNLITTGQYLTEEIAIVSGLTTGSSSDPALSGKVDTLSGNLITTGQTLTTNINTVSTNLISTGNVVDDISGNLITTGQTLQTQITSNDSDISTLTSNLGVTGQTLQAQITSNDSDISTITSNLATTGQTLQTQITSNDSDISTLTSNLATTGQTLTSEIAIVSGIAENASDEALSGKVDTLSGNLITTGQTLQTQITSNDSDITSLTSNLVTTGQTLTTDITTVSGLIVDNDGDITALKTATGVLKTSTDSNAANLITTGQTLQTQITSNDGDISTLTANLGTTGQTLQTQITSNDSDITTLTSNLITTGQTLTSDISTVSGLITDNDADIAALRSATGALKTSTDANTTNLITTGQTLQTQITSNDGDITTLTSNLVTTGQTLQTQITSNDSDISTLTTNLGTTGQTLQTQITSNDGDITNLTSNLITTGQTLTTNINTVATNLGTSGQTLQTQITSNDSDISTLTSNLGTTGQTLQTQITSNDSDIASLTTNLGTTGQTLQTQITSNDSDISTLDSTTVKLTTNQSIAGNKIFTNDVTINNLTVTGTEVIVDVENLAVKDNIIEVNSGESGAGISAISGGIVIDRGTATNANILYNDANDRFELNFPLAVEGEVVASASNLITTGQTLTTNINTVSTNLGTSGQTLQTQITSNDSDISTLTTNLGTTGQTLQTQITSNDSDISTLTANLGTTGQTLQTQITSNDSDISTLTTNLGTTGQTLQTQITSNDSDISTLTSNLVSTGSVVDDISGNLITTGQTLQAQITSNDSNITTLTSNLITTGQTLTTNINTVSTSLISTGKVVDDISGNLVTTGQTLQTQITSNDTDITNLSSNLVTTGQTLTTNISTVATNLVTTGQTLTSEIATVSGLINAGAIDGTGVSGYTARWSDSNTLTTGALYDNGTKVGIGTNSPVAYLTVSGNISASGEFSDYAGEIINTAAGGGEGPGDANYSSVALLLHLNGSNGSTTITDSGPNSLAVTANGNAAISTSQSKFGGASAEFDGNGDYLQVAASSGFDFGTGDFTVELWQRLTSASIAASNERGILQTSNQAGGFSTSYTSGMLIAFGVNGNGSITTNIAGTSVTSSSGVLTADSWDNIVVTRSSGTVRIFVNGTQVAAGTANGDVGGENLVIGGYYNTSFLSTGYIDELRITKGVARYGVNTPPTVTTDLEYNYNLNNGSYSGSGSTLADLTANGYNSTINGATYSTGDRSELSFDGTNDNITTGRSFNLNSNKEYTLEFWVKIDVSQSSFNFTKPLATDYNGGNPYFMVGMRGLGDGTNGGKLDFWERNSSGTEILARTSSTYNDGNWHHVVYVADSSKLRIYVDGASQAVSSSNRPGGTITSGSNWTIMSGNSSFFNGDISIHRFWYGKALSASEVLAEYNNTKSIFTGGSLNLTTQTSEFPNHGGAGSVSGSGLYIKGGSNSSDEYILRALSQNGTDRFTVKGDGNVGIGTTGASTKLHVAGDIKSKGDGKRILLESDDYLVAALTRQGTSGSAADQGGLEIYNAGTAKVGLFANTTSYINNGANFGIGTNSPDYKLTVDAGTTNEIARFKSTDNDALISISDDTDTVYVGLDASADIMSLGFSNSFASTNLSIDTGGNVGIGTNSPQGKLDINTEAAQATHVYINGEVNQDKLLYFRHYANSEGAGNNAYVGYIGSKGVDNVLSLGHLNTSGTDVSIMHLTEAGNVGIGTNVPAAKLHVSNSASSGGTFKFTDGSSRTLMDLGGGILSWNAGSVLGAGSWAGTADHQLQTLGTTRDTVLINGPASGTNHALYVTGLKSYFSGSVGIGTVSPSYKLHVNGGGARIEDGETTLSPDGTGSSGTSSRALSILNLVDSAWTTNALTAYNATTSFDILNRASYSFFARPKSTNIFTHCTEVNDNAHLYRFVNLNSSATEPLLRWYFYQYDGSGTTSGDFKTASKLFEIQHNGSTQLMVQGDGNVGIGEVAPDQKLEVAGAIKSSGAYGFYAGRADTTWASFGTGVPTILLRGSADNSRAGAVQFKEYDGTDTAAIYSTDGTDGYGLVMAAYQGDMKFATGSLTGYKMVILSGGAVGVGTASPNAGSWSNAVTIQGASSVGLELMKGSSLYAFMGVQGSGSSHALDIAAYQNQSIRLRVGSNAGTTAVTILNNGSVGIGITPTRKFHVYGSASSAYLAEFTNTHSTAGYGVLIKAGDDNNVTALSVNDKDGNEKLRVRAGGEITFANAFTFPTADGSSGQVLQTNGSGTVTWATVSGGGGVSGSGTDNYVPRWNGTTALQDSSIIALDNGNVGIGTNAPAAHIHVNKASGTTTVLTEVAAGSIVGYEIKKTGATTQHWKIVDGQTANGYLEIYDATDSATRMAFNTDGNVGIGTVNAPNLLSIKGDAKYFAAYASDGSIAAQLGADSSGDGNFILFDHSGGTKVKLYGESGAANYINNGGNFGVGTASPAALLHVDGQAIIDALHFDSLSSHFIKNDGNLLRIAGDNGVKFQSYDSGWQTRMTIVDDGNVGIGTISPDNPLEVFGADSGIKISSASNNRPHLRLECGTAEKLRLSANTVYGAIGDSSDTNRYMVFKDGNIGIGTNTPSARLDVRGELGANGTAVVSSYFVNVTSGATSSAIYIGASSGTDWKIGKNVTGVTSNTNFSISDHANNRFLDINSSGNVGIGTISPGAKLHVYLTGSAGSFSNIGLFRAGPDSNDSGAEIFVGQQGNSRGLVIRGGRGTGDQALAHFYLNQSGGVIPSTTQDHVMTFLQGGNVGIGTVNPDGRLHVYTGSAGSTTPNTNHDDLTIESSGNAGLQLFTPDANYQYVAFGSPAGANRGYVRYGHNEEEMVLRAATVDILKIKSTGVGIGTTPNSSAKLESYITGGGEKGLRLNSNFSGGNAVDFIPAVVGVSNAGFSIDLAGTTRFVINDGGNVGIGTNSAGGKLHVYGGTTAFTNLSDNTDSIQITRNSSVHTHQDAKLFIYDNSNADWAQKIELGTASYGLRIGGWTDYGVAVYQNTKGLVFSTRTNETVINDGAADYDFRVEGDTDDYLLFTEGSTDRVAISTTAPAAKLHVEGDFKVGTTNNGNWMGYKDVSLNGNTYTTVLTINLNNHTGCYVKLFLSGDWSSHSAVAFVGEYFIQNGSDGYAEPGTVISEFDNTNTDSIESKIVDPSSDTFTIQLKLSTAANGTLGGKLSYHVMGMATAVS